MDIPKGSLPNGSLNNLDKPSSSKKNGSLSNGPLNNSQSAEPSTSKVINVLNSKKEKTPIPSSHIAIAIVDPGFQDPLLSERIVISSKKNEEERSQGVFKQIFCCIK